MQNKASARRLSPLLASSLVWVLLFSLGSPVLPDLRFVKMGAILVLIGFIFVSTPKSTTSALKQALFGLEVLLFAWANVSALMTQTFQFERLILWSIALISCLALARCGWQTLTDGFVRAGIFALMIGWLMTFLGQVPGKLPSSFGWLGLQYRYSGIIGSANGAGLLALVTFTLILRNRNINQRWLAVPILSILGSEYRGGLIAIAFCIFWLSLKKLNTTSANEQFKAFIRVLAIGGFGSFVVRFLSADRKGNGDITTGRGLIWEQCRRIIAEQDLFGGGPELIERLFGLNQSASNRATGSFQFFHCHNQILNDGVNFGYFGIALGLLISVTAFILAVKRNNTAWQLTSFALIIAGLLESPFNYLGVQGDLWPVVLLWAGILALAQENKEVKTDPQPSLAAHT